MNTAAPSASQPPAPRRAFRTGATLLPFAPLAYFAFFSQYLLWPYISLAIAFTLVMFGFRLVGMPWRRRLLFSPLVGVTAVLVAAFFAAGPSAELSRLPLEAWVVLSAAAFAWCISWVLSLFASPPGIGERKL